MEKKYENMDRIIEFGIYLYIIFMFLSKGEGIRNILIFGNFGLWVLTLKYRNNLHLLKDPVSILCWVFLGVIPLSVIFSIDPLYSFLELRGEPLKIAVLYPVIATVMSSEQRLRRSVYVCFFTASLIVLIGYYSYFFHDIPVLRPDTPLMDTGGTGFNKFARYLNTLLPFAFILFLVWKKPGLKLLLVFSCLTSILALILSTSREGYISFFCLVCVWAIYISRTRNLNFARIIASIAGVLLILGCLSWFSSPGVRERISPTFDHLPTLNERTDTWKAAMYAVVKKPLFGWGYGKHIFHQDEPYRDTPHKTAPVKGPHNTFLRILFLQGFTGLISYVFLLLVAIRAFWKQAFKTAGVRSHVLVACVSVLIANYIVNSMLADLELLSRNIAVVLGLGMAAKGTDEDSHT